MAQPTSGWEHHQCRFTRGVSNDCLCSTCGVCKAECPCQELDYEDSGDEEMGGESGPGSEMGGEGMEMGVEPAHLGNGPGLEPEGNQQQQGEVAMAGQGEVEGQGRIMGFSEDEIRDELVGQSLADNAKVILQQKDRSLDQARDRFAHLELPNKQLMEVTEIVKTQSYRWSAAQIIRALVAAGQLREAITLPIADISWGMACMQHGICSHTSDGCHGVLFAYPSKLIGCPNLLRHLDLGWDRSAVSLLFRGFFASSHRHEYVKLGRVMIAAYEWLASCFEDERDEDKQQWCAQQLSRLQQSLASYNEEQSEQQQQRLVTLHRHLCPDCPVTLPIMKQSKSMIAACRRGLKQSERRRLVEILGEDLASRLLWEAPAVDATAPPAIAAVQSAAVQSAAVQPAEVDIPAQEPTAAGEWAEWADAVGAAGQHLAASSSSPAGVHARLEPHGGNPVPFEGMPPLVPQQQPMDDIFCMPWNNQRGVINIMRDYVRTMQVNAVIIGFSLPECYEYYRISEGGGKADRLAEAEWHLYRWDMEYRGMWSGGNLVGGYRQEVLLNLKQYYFENMVGFMPPRVC